MLLSSRMPSLHRSSISRARRPFRKSIWRQASQMKVLVVEFSMVLMSTQSKAGHLPKSLLIVPCSSVEMELFAGDVNFLIRVDDMSIISQRNSRSSKSVKLGMQARSCGTLFVPSGQPHDSEMYQSLRAAKTIILIWRPSQECSIFWSHISRICFELGVDSKNHTNNIFYQYIHRRLTEFEIDVSAGRHKSWHKTSVSQHFAQSRSLFIEFWCDAWMRSYPDFAIRFQIDLNDQERIFSTLMQVIINCNITALFLCTTPFF